LHGEFIVDMKSISTTDLSQEEGRDYLNTHLNSEDFFFTKFFPEAKFSFSNVSLAKEAYLISNNCILEGMLHIKGISKTFLCSVNLLFLENKLILSSSFSFDRTFWNVIYGSSKFFKYLGMHKVFDEINMIYD
jgi:polyisoprenoid-binding protein YceI